MKVSHQIRHQRETLGMSVGEIASAVGVTEQAVRHWESGRSYPGKSTAREIERVLQFSIDWSEGQRSAGGGEDSATAMINPRDLDLLLLLCRLPADFKRAIGVDCAPRMAHASAEGVFTRPGDLTAGCPVECADGR